MACESHVVGKLPVSIVSAFQTFAQIATRDSLQPITREAPVAVTLK